MRCVLSLAVIIAVLASAAVADAQSNDYWINYAGKLPIGSTVRVRTRDGKRTTAVLAIVDETGITIAPKTRRPEPPRRIPFEQLAQIEITQGGMGAGKAVAIGVASGAGVFLAMIALLFATVGD